MANRLIRPIETKYTESQEYIPYRPAYCTTVEKTTVVRTYTSSVVRDVSNVQYGPTGKISGTVVTARGGTGFFDNTGETETETEYVEKCFPEREGQEGRDAETIIDKGEDWRAGATSIETISDGGLFAFDMSASPKAMVGLTYNNTGPNVADIAFGLYFKPYLGGTRVDLIVDGAVVTQNVDSFIPGDRIRLARENGEFVAYVGDGDPVATQPAPSSLPTRLDAMIYSSDTFIDNPVKLFSIYSNGITGALALSGQLAPVGRGAGALAFSGIANVLVDGAYAAAGLSGPVAFTASVASTGHSQPLYPDPGVLAFTAEERAFRQAFVDAALPAMVSLSYEGTYRAVSVQIPPLTMEAAGTGEGTSISLNSAGLSTRPLRMAATGLTGTVGSVDEALEPLTMFSSKGDYGGAVMEMEPMIMYADWGISEDPNFYAFVEPIELQGTVYTEPVIFVSFNDVVEFGETASIFVVVDNDMIEGFLLSEELSLTDFLSRAIESGLEFRTTSGDLPEELVQYAFNVATGAATRYKDFDFREYTTVNGRTFAIGKSGIYELKEGAGNDGDPFDAIVRLVASDFGTSRRKYLDTLYFGIGTDGQVYAKVWADGGKERVYRAIQPGPTRRLRTARGVSAREWQVQLEVVDATEVDLSDVEFVVAASSRRWVK